MNKDNSFRHICGISIFSLCLLAFSFLMQVGEAEAKQYPDCSKCHKVQLTGKNVHPIIKTGGCVACHTQPHEKEAKPRKFLFATGAELCFGCHDRNAFGRNHKHPPVADGQCTLCHNPHISDHPKLLEDEVPALCFRCHDKGKFENKNIHPPVAGGMCMSCHNPHSTEAERLLLAAPPDLCHNCHDRSIFSGKKNLHPPVAGGLCTSCHGVHASPEPKLLLAKMPDLCFMCHDKKAITGKKVDHAPVKGGMCTSCHYPHQSDSPKLLLADVPDICFNCHDKTGFSMENVHPPVAAGMCMECHKPHTSALKGLLAEKSVTKTCMKCHTDFDTSVHVLRGLGRKGHPVDIRKKVKGKKKEKILFSCVSCHNPHSSKSIKLFRFEAAMPSDICKNCHNY